MAGSGRSRHTRAVMTADDGRPPSAPRPLGLSVAAVARRLGVAPATLRTWDRRYGLGPSEHTAGAHRRYTGADLARLDLMRRLVHAGVPPVDAARTALTADIDPATSVLDDPALGLAHQPASEAAEAAASVTVLATGDGPTARAGRAAGGTVVPIPGGTPAARGLARAAMSLDGEACRGIVTDTLDRRGVVWTWDHLLVPVLVGVGERWSSTGRGVEVEHLLSDAVTGALAACTARVFTTSPPVAGRPVLLACAPEEEHALPLHALAAALAERRIPARMLGARVPGSALAAAVQRTGPGAVLVWSQAPGTGELAVMTGLPDLRPAPLLLAAGPGWPAELPAGVGRVRDLTDAVIRIATAVAR